MKYSIRNVDNFYEVEQNNIPKKLHIIWKTDTRRPDFLKKQLKDWARILDASWEIIFWNYYSLETLKNQATTDWEKKIFEIAENQLEMAAYADIIRIYILWKFGGYYLDSDFEVHNSLEPLTHIDSDFIMCNDTDAYFPYVMNAFLACEKGYPFFEHLLQMYIEKHKNPDFYKEWIIKRTGPVFIGLHMLSFEGFNKVIAKIRKECFYNNQIGDKLMIKSPKDPHVIVDEVTEIYEPRFAHHMFVNSHKNCDNLERLEKRKQKDYNKLIDRNVKIQFTKDIVDHYIDARNHEIGEYTYGRPHVTFYEGHKGHVKIGKFCSIGPEVEIFINGYHNTKSVSTYPFSIMCMHDIEEFKEIDFDEKSVPYNKDVVIGNDVYIGERAIIMGNITIGDGAIIAAGAVVTHDVKPYEIVGGNPARHIRFRFTDEQIKKLLVIAWWDWEFQKIKENIQYITSDNVDKFISLFYKSAILYNK